MVRGFPFLVFVCVWNVVMIATSHSGNDILLECGKVLSSLVAFCSVLNTS